MSIYEEMDITQKNQELARLKDEYRALCDKKLQLNMARGKPSKAQLDMVSDILTVLNAPEQCVINGTDVRNYGDLTGIARRKSCSRSCWAASQRSVSSAAAPL